MAGILFSDEYEVIELEFQSNKIEWVNSVNENGQAARRISLYKKCYFFMWDSIDRYAFSEDKPVRGTVGTGYPPYINNHGVVSELPITDAGEKYSINNTGDLCKNGVPIEKTMSWCKMSKIRVNNYGQILGRVMLNNGKYSIVIFNEFNQSITTIPSPLKYPLSPEDINDLGLVVGSYHDGICHHGILWTPQAGTQVLVNFKPAAINNNGTIVGSKWVNNDCLFGHPRSKRRGIIWDQGLFIDISEKLNLDKLFSSNILWITELSDINDQGQIVGWGVDINLQQKGVYITPKNN
ncbi:MAG: hypothetical protein WB791_08450 [Waddliaceae bacterium]